MTLVEPQCQKKKKCGATKLCNREVDSTYCAQLLIFNELLSMILAFLVTITVFYFPGDYLGHTETPVSL